MGWLSTCTNQYKPDYGKTNKQTKTKHKISKGLREKEIMSIMRRKFMEGSTIGTACVQDVKRSHPVYFEASYNDMGVS